MDILAFVMKPDDMRQIIADFVLMKAREGSSKADYPLSHAGPTYRKRLAHKRATRLKAKNQQ